MLLTETITKPKLAFLGTGWIGRHRMAAIHQAGIADCAFISDTDENCISEANKIASQACFAATLEELITAKPDGLVIATPSAMHASQAIAALEAGIPVFCQKPLARNYAETEKVVEAARRANVLLGVDMSYRYTQAMQAVKQLVEEGALGEIYAMNLVFHNAYGPDKAWFYDPKLSGGGCVIDLGIHLVDLALWLLDFPQTLNGTAQLYAGGKPFTGQAKVEDYAAAQFQLENGVNVQLACSWNLPAGKDCEIELSVYGTNGGARFRNLNGSFYDFEALHFEKTKTHVLTSPPDDWGGKAIVAWGRQLAKDATYQEDAEEFLKTALVIDQIYGRTNE